MKKNQKHFWNISFLITVFLTTFFQGYFGWINFCITQCNVFTSSTVIPSVFSELIFSSICSTFILGLFLLKKEKSSWIYSFLQVLILLFLWILFDYQEVVFQHSWSTYSHMESLYSMISSYSIPIITSWSIFLFFLYFFKKELKMRSQ